ncbi:MAG: serine/threonine-protein kinase [Myxococcota bacterium]|nr:serine/threonine-protein kinase [Myxococcota bacterium]
MGAQQPVKFGKYLLVERIGVGGMAEVFKAKIFGAEGFERLVAIKRILPHLVEDDDFVKMFIDEAKIAVRLQHPNIVTIHDLGKAEGTLYIAMEFVAGKDLRALYDYEKERGGRTPVGIACHVVMKMCEALHHAHFATGPRGEPLQVIHRDVSPQNVLLGFDGEVKVADFGLAKARGRMVQTQAGVVKGKLAYMSPEQLRGEEIDHRVDVFGLGIVLYEMLTGERLFLGPSDMDTLRRVYEAKVPPMQPLNPEVAPELEAIVRRALAKDRDERYPTALDLHDDLQAFVYGSGCYAGISSLRKYVREAFPDVAPAPDADLPPTVSVPPEAPTAPPPMHTVQARPTHRPPRMREEIPPPPSDSVLRPPPLEEMSETLTPPSFDDVTTHDDVFEVDDMPTDRPPGLEDVLSATQMPERGVEGSGVEGSGVESSGTVRSLPSVPVGLYEEDFPTQQLHPDDEEHPERDTNPAPPGPDMEPPEFQTEDWEDGPTTYNPTGRTGTNPKPEAASEVDDWEDDATVVIDPRGNHG